MILWITIVIQWFLFLLFCVLILFLCGYQIFVCFFKLVLSKGEQKNRIVKKNRLKFWKNRPVLNKKKNQKKPSQTEKTDPKSSQTKKTKPNRFEPVVVLKNRTEIGQFEPVSVFLKKNFGVVQIRPKMINPSS